MRAWAMAGLVAECVASVSAGKWGNGWRRVRAVGSRTAHDGRKIVVVETGR